jgi:hypothetical protein
MAHTADSREMNVDPDNPTNSLSTAGRTCARPALVSVRSSAVPAAMQRENERNRTVVDGRRTDDGTPCKLVVIHEVGGV